VISLPTAAADHLSGSALTVAFCLEITKVTGGALRLTSHSNDLTIGGNVYASDVGTDATTLKLVNNMGIGGGEVSTLLKSGLITEADIIGGKYDGADYKIFIVDFTQTDLWQVTLTTGLLGELTLEGGQFTTELRSLSQKLNKIIGRMYQPGCDAELFDGRCKVSPAAFTFSGTVLTVTDNKTFTGSPTKAAHFFDYGRIIWLTGGNVGRVSEIKSSDAANGINLFFNTYVPIVAGDTYTIRQGCDKNFATCKAKFSNAINFRGFPHVPGVEQAFIARL
jgi:uncharacterized phage protein (TIGR02218 family)